MDNCVTYQVVSREMQKVLVLFQDIIQWPENTKYNVLLKKLC